MPEHGHRKIAPVKNARSDFGPQTIAQMRTAIQRNHRADIAIKVREFREHRDPVIKVIGIERAALVSRNALRSRSRRTPAADAAASDRPALALTTGTVFSPPVCASSGRPAIRHSFPERAITHVRGIDVLAIRQAFHQDRAALKATFQFVEGIRARRMNGNPGEELRMRLREVEDDVIGHKHRTEIRARVPSASCTRSCASRTIASNEESRTSLSRWFA